MTLFLFLKQFVDLLYQYRFLDYLMVFFVLIMLGYQIALVRPDVTSIRFTDIVVLILGILVTISFLRDSSCYRIYFKVLSAFLMYFVGRIYYDRIQECYGALVTAGYGIVYLNLAYRIISFGLQAVTVDNAEGDLYYYDTDMAFAIILAMTFIVMFGHNTVFKYITVLGVCPYMVFRSDAGIQMVLLLSIYAIVIIYVMELVLENRKVTDVMLSIIIVGLLAIITIIYLPVFGLADDDVILTMFGSRFLDNDNMYGRYDVWRTSLVQLRQFGTTVCLFGGKLGVNSNIGSLYIKTITSVGYIGMAIAVIFIFSVVYYVIKVKDRKTFYVTIILAVMLLGTGVTVCSMEFTQMSWFPMMFAGMVVSSVEIEKEEIKVKE